MALTGDIRQTLALARRTTAFPRDLMRQSSNDFPTHQGPMTCVFFDF
jgi:hypothetical protein